MFKLSVNRQCLHWGCGNIPGAMHYFEECLALGNVATSPSVIINVDNIIALWGSVHQKSCNKIATYTAAIWQVEYKIVSRNHQMQSTLSNIPSLGKNSTAMGYLWRPWCFKICYPTTTRNKKKAVPFKMHQKCRFPMKVTEFYNIFHGAWAAEKLFIVRQPNSTLLI